MSSEVTAVAFPRPGEAKPLTRSSSPERLLGEARDGSGPAREELIRRFTPFVLKTAAEVTGRYLRLGQDDEASVGLIAFNEAINSFDPSRGVGFLTFAETVIRRRLIDHFRKQTGARRETPLSAFEVEDEEGNTTSFLEAQEALAAHQADLDALERREEVLRYTRLLDDYGISLDDLVALSPKHRDARERAIAIARTIAADPELREHLRHRRELPLKALADSVALSRKTLERQRKYIIAVAIILMEDLGHLKEYLRPNGGAAWR